MDVRFWCQAHHAAPRAYVCRVGGRVARSADATWRRGTAWPRSASVSTPNWWWKRWFWPASARHRTPSRRWCRTTSPAATARRPAPSSRTGTCGRSTPSPGTAGLIPAPAASPAGGQAAAWSGSPRAERRGRRHRPPWPHLPRSRAAPYRPTARLVPLSAHRAHRHGAGGALRGRSHVLGGLIRTSRRPRRPPPRGVPAPVAEPTVSADASSRQTPTGGSGVRGRADRP